MNKNILLVFLFLITTAVIKINPQSKIPQKFLTKFEKSGYIETERYKETIDFFKRIELNSPYAKLVSFGISPQGRNLYCLIVSKDKTFTPEAAKKTKKPVILIENGIHAGEIEGKDASMILLREILITKEKQRLLDNAILMVVPIFNVDGHERFGKYNRINQNGPIEMGWRTTAQNLNLNRDWMKADAPEMQAMLKLFSTWLPDFFIDTHTTDGADYQYTITYAMEKFSNIYSGTRNWIRNEFIPFMEKRVEDAGFLVAPYLGFKDGELEKGIVDWAATPRFSQGYAALQNRPGLLIETHMLKPYKDRVFSTKAMIEAVIDYANLHPKELVELNNTADENSIKNISIEKKFLPIAFKPSDAHTTFLFKGIKAVKDSSNISGTIRTTYSGEKENITIPYFNKMNVKDSVESPKAYLIPLEWKEIADRMKLHGISIHQLKNDETFSVKRYKFKNVKFASSSYEGRQRVDFDYDEYSESVTVPKGTYIVYTNQRTIRVILNLLELKAGDSFVRWGFFNVVFEKKEYFEDYVMEKVAPEMMKENPLLKAEFEKKLAEDNKFRNDPYARLNFFYERSPYFDKEYDVYPVMRID